MEEYEGENLKVKLHAALICTCCCCFGMVLGIGAFFAYSNNMHCDISLLSCDVIDNDHSQNRSYNHSYNHSYIEYINQTNITRNYSYVDDSMNISNSTYDNGQVLDNETMLDIVNKSVLFYARNVIRNDIERKVESQSGGMDAGTAMAVSISSVFIFIGCMLSCGWYVKYKPNPIKNMVTNRTASKSIKMTKEEIEFSQINPILKSFGENNKSLLVKAIKNITYATDKDGSHDFPEAIGLYEKGIDLLLVYMKSSVNADERFQMAKKVDMYVQRVIYLKKVVANRSLLEPERITPAAPLMENK